MGRDLSTSSGAHRLTAEQAHAPAVLGREAALPASTKVRGAARTDVRAHLHELGVAPPILGVEFAAVKADGARGTRPGHLLVASGMGTPPGAVLTTAHRARKRKI